MKLNLIAAACLCALAGAAHAIAPSVTPFATLYVSGSSAQNDSLGAIAEYMFQSGSITVMTDQTTSTPGSSYRAYYGTMKPGIIPSADNQNVLIVDRSAGGSYYGLGPVARSQSIAFMAVNSSCTALSGATYPNPQYSCTSTTNAVPDVGVSDEEPTLFIGNNVPSGTIDGQSNSALSTTELASLTIQPEYQVLLGIAVTNNVGITNLSKSQVAAILAGNYTDWSQLGLSAGPIVVQSRASGSGTLAGASAYFLNYPCAEGSQGAIAPASAQGDGSSIYSVIANSSSGNLIKALDADYTAGVRALGILGVEYQPGTSDHYSFVSINGTAPTQANAVSGAYDYFVTQSIQYRSATPAGVKLDLINGFISSATNPSVVLSVAGTALDPTINTNATYAAETTLGTRFGNTCSPLQLYPYEF